MGCLQLHNLFAQLYLWLGFRHGINLKINNAPCSDFAPILRCWILIEYSRRINYNLILPSHVPFIKQHRYKTKNWHTIQMKGIKMCRYHHQCIVPIFYHSIFFFHESMTMEGNNDDKITGWNISSQSPPPLIHNVRTGCCSKSWLKKGELNTSHSPPPWLQTVLFCRKLWQLQLEWKVYYTSSIQVEGLPHFTKTGYCVKNLKEQASNTGHSAPPPTLMHYSLSTRATNIFQGVLSSMSINSKLAVRSN